MDFEKLKNTEHYSYIVLPFDYTAVAKTFRSKYSAKKALKEYLIKPYEAAKAI